MTFITNNTDETREVGRKIAEILYTGGHKNTYIAMQGEMGVGKTAFTSGFASYFGIVGVKSPTYSIMNQHTAGGVKLYHFDMYRIMDEDDLYSIGYDDYAEGDGYKIIEWSENISDLIPTDAVIIKISRTPECEDKRIIEVKGGVFE